MFAKRIGLRTAGRLFRRYTHLMNIAPGVPSQVDIGDGKLPFPALFKQLKKMGYQGCVNMEYEINAKDPMLGMQRSLSYMRGVLAGLAG